MKTTVLNILIVLIFMTPIFAEDFSDLVEKGNIALEENNYQEALGYYRQAEAARPESPELDYNIGGALYKDGKYEEAEAKLQRSLKTDDIQQEINSHYNLGNVYYRIGDYQKAIQAYQKSLELNPEDIDAKYNLELSRKMLKEQMKPENQEQQQQQQQQEEKNKEEEEQQQQQDQQKQDQQQEEQKQQPQPEEIDENEMSKEDAERILNAIKDDEKELQKEQKRVNTKGTYKGDDW